MPVRFQLLDHGNGVGAQYVGDGDGSEESGGASTFVDLADDHGCLALVLQGGDLPSETLRTRDFLRGEIAHVADGDAPAVYEAARAFAGGGLKGGALLQRQPALLALLDDGLGERMLGFGFDGGGKLQQGEGGCIGFAAKINDAAIHDHVRDTPACPR